MQTDFKVREREPMTVVSKHTPVRMANIGAVIGASFAEVYGALGPTGAASGEPFVIYHGSPSGDDPPFEIEICAPTVRAVTPPHGWNVTELPAGTFASVLHVGAYDSLSTAYDELGAWIGRQGFAIVGPPREVYLSEPSTPAAETRTVVEFPVVASTAAVPVAIS
ncbi:MAG: GyrI-like domain-containing protein [Chloroflexota bacterium]